MNQLGSFFFPIENRQSFISVFNLYPYFKYMQHLDHRSII